MAQAEGNEANDAAAVAADGPERRKRVNEEWVNLHDQEAGIARLKDGRAVLPVRLRSQTFAAGGFLSRQESRKKRETYKLFKRRVGG